VSLSFNNSQSGSFGGLIGGIYKFSTLLLFNITTNGSISINSPTNYHQFGSNILGMLTTSSFYNITNSTINMSMTGN